MSIKIRVTIMRERRSFLIGSDLRVLETGRIIPWQSWNILSDSSSCLRLTNGVSHARRTYARRTDSVSWHRSGQKCIESPLAMELWSNSGKGSVSVRDQRDWHEWNTFSVACLAGVCPARFARQSLGHVGAIISFGGTAYGCPAGNV